ncbi:ABC transporter permease [Clostridium nigeriense]|nr:ABC transporter permease [Clostridium nigeriense]
MLNTIKLVLKKKSFIVMGIIAPGIIIVFFTFVFGKDVNYKVGVIDKDNKYISREVIKAISEIENVDILDASNDNYEMLLISHQIQLAVIIEEGFSERLLNLNKCDVITKSISNSDVKEILVSTIKRRVNNLSLIAKVSDKNLEEFMKLNENTQKNIVNYNLSNIIESKPSIENSIGIVIMMILISGAAIASFLIEDEEHQTKARVLVSGIPEYKYYFSLLLVFYLLSSISSIIYYTLCKILNLDFGMSNTNNFLVVMLFLNLVSISLNLFIVSLTRNRYVSSTINILIVIPTCMISGVFWNFDVMSDSLKKIGSLMPQRLVYVSIKKLQAYENLYYIRDYMLYMICISLIFFILSLIIFNNKRVKN